MSIENSAITLQHVIDINQQLMGSTEPDDVIRTVLESAIQLFNLEACSLALLDESTQELAFVALESPVPIKEFRIPVGEGIAGQVAKTGKGIICNDVAGNLHFKDNIDQKTSFATRSILCAPIKQHNQIIGVIEALNTRQPDGFDSEDLELLTTYGVMAGTAIIHTQAFATVRNIGTAFREIVQDRYQLVKGTSEAMQQALTVAHTVASADTTVLILGETGTGKEVIARAIHQWSPRATGPFVAVNCMALTPELLTSELFGHEKGAFTGATSQKKGKFEMAQGGTIFLDEIGDLEPDLQARLLRVLQEKEFQRVGGNKDIRADVRVLAATNRDLREAIERRTFREDLYYRLNVVGVELPPLRDRRDDISIFVDHFIDRFCREMSRPKLEITAPAREVLQTYSWPGNVRELQNVIERAVVLSSGSTITERSFAAEIRQSERRVDEAGSLNDGIEESLDLSEAVQAFKRNRVNQALKTVGGNRAEAAKMLGLQTSNLSRLMQTLGLR